jgi:hypothetical protein
VLEQGRQGFLAQYGDDGARGLPRRLNRPHEPPDPSSSIVHSARPICVARAEEQSGVVAGEGGSGVGAGLGCGVQGLDDLNAHSPPYSRRFVHNRARLTIVAA